MQSLLSLVFKSAPALASARIELTESETMSIGAKPVLLLALASAPQPARSSIAG